MKLLHKTAATAAVAGMMLAGGMAAPAYAAPPLVQGGLINVSVGDVTILEDVNIGVAANVAVTICDTNVAVLVGELVDVGEATCESGEGQTITLTQA